MKTKLLFTAMVLIGLTSANATKTNVALQEEDLMNSARYRYAEPIMFMERGVEFLIFPDGSFDFNTAVGDSFGYYDDAYYKQNYLRRSAVNNTQGAPMGVSRSSYHIDNVGGILIQHDFDGKVRRIGNVFINYDRIGKVKRVGSIYMNYNRGGLLTQVGGLRITYNNWGEIVHSSGIVNYNNNQYNSQLGLSLGDNYGNYNDYDHDEEYYYYRKGDKVKKQKKMKK